jgi:hypothetical protein
MRAHFARLGGALLDALLPPANFSQSEFPAITGAFQLPKDLLLILDTDVIFETKIAKVKTKSRVF